MKPGDRILVPPAGTLASTGWVEATVERVGKDRLIRDPTPDRDHRRHQPIYVVYDDGKRDQFDRYWLEPRQL